VHVCGKIYFIGTFKFFIGTFNFIYCRNRKNQNHATSRLRKNLAVPYRKNKQKLQPTSADAVVEIFTPITTIRLQTLAFHESVCCFFSNSIVVELLLHFGAVK